MEIGHAWDRCSAAAADLMQVFGAFEHHLLSVGRAHLKRTCHTHTQMQGAHKIAPHKRPPQAHLF